MAKPMSRPFGITALTIFFFAATGITLVAAVSLLFPNGLLELIWKLNTLLFVFDFLQPDCNLQRSADLQWRSRLTLCAEPFPRT